jgi:hypothetical protein
MEVAVLDLDETRNSSVFRAVLIVAAGHALPTRMNSISTVGAMKSRLFSD